MRKGLKIDVQNKQVTEVTIGDDYREIYGFIGNDCRCFTAPVRFENQDTLYCDDDGIFNKKIGGFQLQNWDYPILGNALILGSDGKGGSIDHKSTIEEIEKQITWVSQEAAESYASRF